MRGPKSSYGCCVAGTMLVAWRLHNYTASLLMSDPDQPLYLTPKDMAGARIAASRPASILWWTSSQGNESAYCLWLCWTQGRYEQLPFAAFMMEDWANQR